MILNNFQQRALQSVNEGSELMNAYLKLISGDHDASDRIEAFILAAEEAVGHKGKLFRRTRDKYGFWGDLGGVATIYVTPLKDGGILVKTEDPVNEVEPGQNRKTFATKTKADLNKFIDWLDRVV